jgi:hypothetical protein
MARRIPFAGKVQAGPAKLSAVGYRPTASSRFAVTRLADRPDSPWTMTHVRTGMGVGSIIPAVSRKLTLAERLEICAAWEAMTHLDWSAFDELPEIGPDTNGAPVINQAKVGPTVRAMREAAATVLGC